MKIFAIRKDDQNEPSQSRKTDKRMQAVFLAVAGVVFGGYFYDASSAFQTVDGEVVSKYHQSKGGYIVKVLLTSGAHKGEVVRDKVPMWEYEKISPNSEVTIDVAEGKLTGLLHTDNTQVKAKPKM